MVNQAIDHVPETNVSDIQKIFDSQKSNQFNIGNTGAKERKAKLTKLLKAINQYRPQIKEALYKDYKKHPSEVDMTEILLITSEIKHARKKLYGWMRNHSVPTPIAMLGSTSYVKYEPKGVTLIISPWNFPFNLTFCPLVSAIAAGNTVMIKPSEHTPHSSALMKKIINELFDENEVALIEGGVSTSKALLELPFNHIFFTGAPSIGKIVMKAAAENLTSVTLELGGKSPTIVDETASIKTAARRIAWAKFLNNGQICICPDYVYVHESKKEDLIKEIKNQIDKLYSEDHKTSDSYNRIVNNHHFNRVKNALNDALEKGAQIEIGGTSDEDQNYIAPTVVTNVDMSSELMTEEIFGPVLPVFSYNTISEVLDKINSGEKPLALYIYSKSKKNIDHILNNTRAGGSAINHSLVHFFNIDLPFGGTNNSGIGKAHGAEGFKAFSNDRGILKQHVPNAVELLMPPYNNLKQKLIDFTVKWL